jgi:hypothetical protein
VRQTAWLWTWVAGTAPKNNESSADNPKAA